MSLYVLTCLVMAIPVLGGAGWVAMILRGLDRRLWLVSVACSVAALLVLTAVFDNIMIGVGLVDYDLETTSGIRIGLAPIEDFAYAIAAGIGAPTVFTLVNRKGRSRAGGDRATGADVSTATGTSPAPHRRSLMVELFWTSRPVSWINTAAPFLLAYLLAAGTVDVRAVLGTLFFLVPYNLAMYGINDVYDYESDLRNPRKGGVEGSVLDRSRHRATLIAAAVSCVPFIVYLLAVGSVESRLILAAAMFAVVAYSLGGLRFKEIPFLDSITSATHFVAPAAFGWALAGESFTAPVWVCLAAFALWGMGSHSFGAVQDIRADREGGLKSVGTVLGARATVWFSFTCYAVAAVLLLVAAPWPASGAAFAALPYLACVGAYLRVTDATSEATNKGWKWFLVLNILAGFLVTQLVLWQVLIWG